MTRRRRSHGQFLRGSAWLSAFAIALCALAVPHGSAEEATPIRLTGTQVSAVATSLQKFETSGKSLTNYGVWIEQMSEEIVVIFVPNRRADEMDLRGGRTDAGEEIRFHVTLDGKDIRKVSYGR